MNTKLHRNIFSRLTSLSIAIALVVACASVTGCSSNKKGSGSGSEGGLSESDLNAQREDRFGSANIPNAEGEGLFHDVRFDYDSSSLTPEAQNDIDYNAKVLRDQSQLKLVLEGHCDERGTAEYNMALGAKRASAVKQALISMGISSSRIDTISYGEEVPLDPGHSEMAWAKNRRVHFSPFTGE